MAIGCFNQNGFQGVLERRERSSEIGIGGWSKESARLKGNLKGVTVRRKLKTVVYFSLAVNGHFSYDKKDMNIFVYWVNEIIHTMSME